MPLRFLGLLTVASIVFLGCGPQPVVVEEHPDAVDVEVDTDRDVEVDSTVPPATTAPPAENTGVDVNLGGGRGVDVEVNRDANGAVPSEGVDVGVGGGQGVDVNVDPPADQQK